MRVYDGSQWIAASAASQAILTKYKYVATAGQTTFTGSDANSLTLAYTVGSIIVTLNGVVLNGTDYTATTGTSVVLAVAASLNDELNVLSFSTFDVANTYTQAQADARYLNLAGGTLTGDVRLNNGSADGAQFQLASSGYSDWNLDNYSGRLRAYYGSTEYMTINASGNVGIGTSSPSYKLDVQSSAASGIVGRFVASGGGASGYMYSGGDFYLASDTSANTSIGLNSSSNYVRFWTNGNERARIDSSGNLLVGTTSVPNGSANGFAIQSGGYFQTSRASTGAGIIHAQFQNPNGVVGSITTGGSSTSYVTSSDYRLKENIVPMTGALGVVAQLNPVTYTWKTDGADGQGFIAHELQAVVPEAVVGEKDAVETYLDEEGNEQTRPVYQGIDTSFLVATLTAAIQELKAVVDAQAARIEALEQA